MDPSEDKVEKAFSSCDSFSVHLFVIFGLNVDFGLTHESLVVLGREFRPSMNHSTLVPRQTLFRLLSR